MSDEDSAMALKVARQVIELIEDNDYRVVDAIVVQRDRDGKCEGMHDPVCEKRGASGLVSFESASTARTF